MTDSLTDRAMAILDDGFVSQIKKHFYGICLQIDSDSAPELHKAMLEKHFSKGVRDVCLAYQLTKEELTGLLKCLTS